MAVFKAVLQLRWCHTGSRGGSFPREKITKGGVVSGHTNCETAIGRILGRRFERLRTDSAPSRKDVPQGRKLAAARQPDVFSIIYGTTSRALVQSPSFSAGSLVHDVYTG